MKTVDNLVFISLKYSKNFLFTPSILYDVTRFLTWENINAIDVNLTKTELSLIIDKKDFMRCYKTLRRLAENSEEGEKTLKKF